MVKNFADFAVLQACSERKDVRHQRRQSHVGHALVAVAVVGSSLGVGPDNCHASRDNLVNVRVYTAKARNVTAPCFEVLRNSSFGRLVCFVVARGRSIHVTLNDRQAQRRLTVKRI